MEQTTCAASGDSLTRRTVSSSTEAARAEEDLQARDDDAPSREEETRHEQEEEMEDSEDDEEARERLMLAEAKKLSAEVKQNPWRGADGALTFQRLAELYRHLGEYEKLNRTARLACVYCPVGEEFLLSWLEEEKRVARLLSGAAFESSFPSHQLPLPREQHLHIRRLYRLARFVLPSVSLALSHLRFEEAAFFASSGAFSFSRSSSSSVSPSSVVSAEGIRGMFEEALDDFALHALEGPCLWAAYRHFESAILDSLRRRQLEKRDSGKQEGKQDRGQQEGRLETGGGNHEEESEVVRQMHRIQQLFCRQLQLPLAGLGDLLDEYRLVAGNGADAKGREKGETEKKGEGETEKKEERTRWGEERRRQKE
ncbi:RNA recognition motif protein [Toxoplasma gondii MAS]|uniref:RNA recognition motif protein n=1 Tax=Toxoplasma gondii MAS TaxID=943118 RepID=A0A086PZK8_TOXGO|nr:RNA recognition motif protein [Toxoplasma gondii MAS]